MAASIMQNPLSRRALTPPLEASKLSLETSGLEGLPIPNKHIPHCPTGPAPGLRPEIATPPDTPPSKYPHSDPTSFFQPKNPHYRSKGSAPIFPVDIESLAKALSHLATQLLPDPKLVFPWLHGLHAENQMQLAFFAARRKSIRSTPECLRSITIVKLGDDLTQSKLKGAIAAEELLDGGVQHKDVFLDANPREGFSVRNFQSQQAKAATVSDIVVYGDAEAGKEEILELASQFALAQRTCRDQRRQDEEASLEFHTYVLTSSFDEIEDAHPELIDIDSKGQPTEHSIDLMRWEHEEMARMSKTSEIAKNVWVGPTMDLALCPSLSLGSSTIPEGFDIYIETSDTAQIPSTRTLNLINSPTASRPQHLDFPASGTMVVTKGADFSKPFIQICQWINQLANPMESSPSKVDAGDKTVKLATTCQRPRKVFIHCADGYTESTLLATTYLMYVEGVPLHEAWLRLHSRQQRNFFAYPSDLILLSSLQSRILQASPSSEYQGLKPLQNPRWLSQMDGSFPSRILPHLYLGNIGHANNPDMLRAIGIGKLISVGEPVSWSKEQMDLWGRENILAIDRVQDNGVDSLTDVLEKAIDFIDSESASIPATLVHCRVGVSRSATICIAAIMASLRLSFPRAYCYVRARRLNVIIQPHLRFVWELMKWDEELQRRRGETIKREMEWAEICGQIASMNKPYAR